MARAGRGVPVLPVILSPRQQPQASVPRARQLLVVRQDRPRMVPPPVLVLRPAAAPVAAAPRVRQVVIGRPAIRPTAPPRAVVLRAPVPRRAPGVSVGSQPRPRQAASRVTVLRPAPAAVTPQPAARQVVVLRHQARLRPALRPAVAVARPVAVVPSAAPRQIVISRAPVRTLAVGRPLVAVPPRPPVAAALVRQIFVGRVRHRPPLAPRVIVTIRRPAAATVPAPRPTTLILRSPTQRPPVARPLVYRRPPSVAPVRRPQVVIGRNDRPRHIGGRRGRFAERAAPAAPPPPFTVGALTTQTAPTATLAAGDAGAYLTGSTAATGTVTTTTAPTGGPT